MLRLFSSRCCNLLLKRAFVTFQREVSCSPWANRIKPYRISISVSHFSTESPGREDSTRVEKDDSKPTEAIDLDKWKSVMRSQASFQEQKPADNMEQSEDVGILDQTGAELKDSSSLEATRELVSMWQQAGKLVPQDMTEEEIRTLAGLTTKSSRKKYLKYLAIKEGNKLSRKEKQQKKAAEREASLKEKRELSSEGDQDGHKPKNTLFLQFWERSLDTMLAWRTAQAMVFGQSLVFDMSYESNMSRREIENTVSQLLEVEGWNRRSTDPFHLHFCNLQPDGLYMKQLVKRYGAETWERLHITSTEQQYIDLFPREQLVYLTADSPNVLRNFDKSKIYIIGALVDRSCQSGLSLANAKRLKLATARLPLDEFLHWDLGAKNLTLDQMIRIMLTIRDTGKWEEALKFVPLRKHGGFHQQLIQTENANSRIRRFSNHGFREDNDGPLTSKERDSGKTFKSQNTHKSGKEFGLGGRKNSTKVRTSLKNNMETRKSASSYKMWWQDE